MAKQTFTTGQVLTAAQMTSLQQTAMLGGAASAKTASYTLVAADAGTAISMSNASATTITVNTALFAAGDTVQITNLGAGVCTITAGTATVNTSASLALAQYESGTLDFISTSAAIFIKGAAGAAASGGMTLLDTLTLSGASVTSTTFSSSYKQLLVYVKKAYGTAGLWKMRMNGNTGSVYSYNYTYASGSHAYDEANNTSFYRMGYLSGSTSTSRKTYSITTITRPSDTDVVFICTNENFGGDPSYVYQGYGVGNFIDGSNPITSITLFPNSGSFSGGEAFIYGVN